MNKLSNRTTKLAFETDSRMHDAGRYREIVAEAKPSYLSVRLKGLHTSFDVSYAAIYCMAAKAHADKIRSEKRAAKKAGK